MSRRFTVQAMIEGPVSDHGGRKEQWLLMSDSADIQFDFSHFSGSLKYLLRELILGKIVVISRVSNLNSCGPTALVDPDVQALTSVH